MGADASIDLELNAKQLYSELAVAEKKYTQGMERIGASTNRAGGAMDGIKVKTKAAGRQIHNFAQDLTAGADAGVLLQDAMMGVGKSLGLSLGALSSIMIGAVVAEKVHEMRKEYKALNDEIDKLNTAKPGADFRTLEEIEKHANEATAALEKLRERMTDRSGATGVTGGAWQKFKDYLYYGRGSFAAGGADKERAADIEAGRDRDLGDRASKFQRRMRNREDALNGEPDFISKAKKLRQDADEKSHATQQAVVELMAELELSFRELAASVASKRRDRVQQSLGELAAIPEFVQSGMTHDQWQAGMNARKAQAWDAEAERRRMNYDPAGAQEALNYSTEIKRSIPGLKDSEKDLKGEFKGALDESTVLKEIKQNTDGMFKGR
ncbi:MAG: hypothetical protein V7609_2081 [Verrucomicrobiota bacterium]